MKYVWLNINNGQFSNSWGDAEHAYLTQDEIERVTNDGWKLLKYECVNDAAFELSNLMRLR